MTNSSNGSIVGMQKGRQIGRIAEIDRQSVSGNSRQAIWHNGRRAFVQRADILN